jgi:hypothetical protein
MLAVHVQSPLLLTIVMIFALVGIGIGIFFYRRVGVVRKRKRAMVIEEWVQDEEGYKYLIAQGFKIKEQNFDRKIIGYYQEYQVAIWYEKGSSYWSKMPIYSSPEDNLMKVRITFSKPENFTPNKFLKIRSKYEQKSGYGDARTVRFTDNSLNASRVWRPSNRTKLEMVQFLEQLLGYLEIEGLYPK